MPGQLLWNKVQDEKSYGFQDINEFDAVRKLPSTRASRIRFISWNR